jgi:hypothetical protein
MVEDKPIILERGQSLELSKFKAIQQLTTRIWELVKGSPAHIKILPVQWRWVKKFCLPMVVFQL